MDKELSAEIVAQLKANERRAAFAARLQRAEQHWFFIQAMQCLDQELYIPATSSLLNGIEATLRIYVQRYSGEKIDWAVEPSAYRVLSNTLILQAQALGLSVDRLAFPGEKDFNQKLLSVKPNRQDVRLVALRNNICHGNVWEFLKDFSGKRDIIFVPELLKPVAIQLLEISEGWAVELQRFREERAQKK